jgi:hypothetical protein
MQDTPIKWLGRGEGSTLLPTNVFAYKDGKVPVWLHRGFVYSSYSLSVFVDSNVVQDGRQRRSRMKVCYVEQPLNTTRQQHWDLLVAMCDLITLYNGVEYSVVGGNQRMHKLLKPKRRR